MAGIKDNPSLKPGMRDLSLVKENKECWIIHFLKQLQGWENYSLCKSRNEVVSLLCKYYAKGAYIVKPVMSFKDSNRITSCIFLISVHINRNLFNK